MMPASASVAFTKAERLRSRRATSAWTSAAASGVSEMCGSCRRLPHEWATNGGVSASARARCCALHCRAPSPLRVYVRGGDHAAEAATGSGHCRGPHDEGEGHTMDKQREQAVEVE